MDKIVNTENDCCKSVHIECSPAEFLVLNKALKYFSENSENEDDRRLAQELFDVHPIFRIEHRYVDIKPVLEMAKKLDFGMVTVDLLEALEVVTKNEIL